MHYFTHNPKQYALQASHLSNDEDLAYRRLLDMYYHTEMPIPENLPWLVRRIRVAKEVLEVVLADFFTLQTDGWHHQGVAAEIAEYHAQAEKNRQNGKKGGRPKTQTEPNPNPLLSENNPSETEWQGNQKPLNNNYEPITRGDQKHTEQDLERARENSPKVSSHSENLCTEGLKTIAGDICIALNAQGVTGVNPCYQPLLEAIAQGCDVSDFNYAVAVGTEAKKLTFPYIVGIAKNAMADAKYRLANPSKSRSKYDSIQFTTDVLTGRVKLPERPEWRDITADCDAFADDRVF
jgi:uncharacterized protein YdaU (DUF1376 family)